MNQLESSGVLGTVKIRKAGYPVRIPHEKFVRRYMVVATDFSSNQSIITSALGAGGIEMPARAQIGHTKVFLKADAYQWLEKVRVKALEGKIKLMQAFGKGYLDRKVMWLAFIERHREAMLAAKREREEKERAEREALERARKEEEERLRRIKEAEERARKEKELREASMRETASIALQRYIRGGLARHRIYRTVLEQFRADFEREKERKAMTERLLVSDIDIARHRTERQWVAWLNEVDDLQRYQETEKARLQEKENQKKRILGREIGKKEEAARQLIKDEAYKEAEMLFAKFEVMRKHKMDLASKTRQLEDMAAKRRAANQRNASPIRAPQPQLISRSAAAASDSKSRETLADYAVRRAMQFDTSFTNVSSSNAYNNSTAQHRASTPRGTASASSGAFAPRSPSLFERSKNRWTRQEEFIDSRLSFEGAFHMDPSYERNAFSGPYRAGVSPMAAQSTFRGPPPPSASSPTQNRAPSSTMNAQLRGAYEWHSVFNN
eukprot:GILI01016936.1.p1 GENE.GILI01016936.1~~GILI01016936.1.p1  ORF type:complete len:560 (-),score=131.17 GILI01016936.1:117-1607(-)